MKPGVVAHSCNLSFYSESKGRRISNSRPALAELSRTLSKANKHMHTHTAKKKEERTGDVFQLVQCLSSMLKALGSILSTAKKKVSL
jgi:hypothetical protein